MTATLDEHRKAGWLVAGLREEREVLAGAELVAVTETFALREEPPRR